MKRLWRVAAGVVLTVMAVLPMAQPVYATEPEPDSVTLSGIKLFSGLIVDGDWLVFVPYNISYTTTPSSTIDNTIIFRLLSPDGSAEIGTATATPAYDDGYGIGLVSFYVTGLTANTSYIVRVQENPVYYPASQYWNFVLDADNYVDDEDQESSLKAAIITESQLLKTQFGVDLLTTSEAGEWVLSAYGESYYLNAIPGLQSMCSSVFGVQTENPNFTKRSWSTALADTLRTQYDGTFIGDAMTGFAGLFSIDVSPAMVMVSVVAWLIVIMISIWKFKATMLSAFGDGYLALLLLMLCGVFSMIWTGFIAFASASFGGLVLFFKRS